MTDWDQHKVSPNDNRVSSQAGMQKQDALQVREFCKGVYRGKDLMIIIRGSKPTSLQHHYQADMSPKPITVKTKIPYEAGVLEEDGHRYISDYDLQGVYELRDNGAYYRLYVGNGAHARPTGPMENPFLRCINEFVRPGSTTNTAFFQHGPNDDYLDCGRPKNDGIGNVFLAFVPDGDLFLIPDRTTLKEFYHRQRISWNYAMGGE